MEINDKNKGIKVVKKDRRYVNILKFNIDSTSRGKVLSKVRDRINRLERFIIFTPNPEIIVKGKRDKGYGEILNQADISLPDGVGLAIAYRFLSLRNPQSRIIRVPVLLFQGIFVLAAFIFRKSWIEKDIEIIKGREMFVDLIKLANKKGWRVFLFGGRGDVAEKTKIILKRSFKKVDIECASGPELDSDARPGSHADEKALKEVIEKINRFKPHLLFVALGAPKQEKWVYRWRNKLNATGIMIVGGTYDYVSGEVGRTPGYFEKAGFEWFWRCISQPKRIARVANAVIIFLSYVYLDKLKS